MNDDLRELLGLLNSQGVEYLVIGAHAVGYHSRPRMTGDLDIFLGRSESNAARLESALRAFGADIGSEGARRFRDLDRQMIRIGVPPNQVDILNFAGEDSFEDVWARRVAGMLAGVPVHFPAKRDLIAMKAAAGRPQDLADIERLKDP
jgi:predicted nucleotidyltransferase